MPDGRCLWAERDQRSGLQGKWVRDGQSPFGGFIDKAVGFVGARVGGVDFMDGALGVGSALSTAWKPNRLILMRGAARSGLRLFSGRSPLCTGRRGVFFMWAVRAFTRAFKARACGFFDFCFIFS